MDGDNEEVKKTDIVKGLNIDDLDDWLIRRENSIEV